jgi:MBOAT, membrane-bound O-acyltransferase family
MPLGGNRHGLSRQFIALLATMALGGLWHGADWHFIFWGVLHGIALAVELAWRRFVRIALPSIVGWGLTFSFVTLAWVFFRAPSLAVAGRVLTLMVDGGTSPSYNGIRTLAVAAVCAIALPPSRVTKYELVINVQGARPCHPGNAVGERGDRIRNLAAHNIWTAGFRNGSSETPSVATAVEELASTPDAKAGNRYAAD